MKINLNEFIGTVATQYAEAVKSEKFVQVENMSFDFMIQTNSSWDDFRNGIILFRKTLMENKWVDLHKTQFFISSMRYHGKAIHLVSLTKQMDFKEAESAKFFEDGTLNNWMIAQINSYLDKGVAVEVYPGIVLRKNGDEYTVLCSKKFMEE